MCCAIASTGTTCRGALVPIVMLSAFLVTSVPSTAGPFTQRQAESGQAVYNDHCAECHRPDLTGALGPALVGTAFRRTWAGKPVAELRDWIGANMPPNAPGTLPDDQLDPIVALILLRNDVMPGPTPLSAATAGGRFPNE